MVCSVNSIERVVRHLSNPVGDVTEGGSCSDRRTIDNTVTVHILYMHDRRMVYMVGCCGCSQLTTTSLWSRETRRHNALGSIIYLIIISNVTTPHPAPIRPLFLYSFLYFDSKNLFDSRPTHYPDDMCLSLPYILEYIQVRLSPGTVLFRLQT